VERFQQIFPGFTQFFMLWHKLAVIIPKLSGLAEILALAVSNKKNQLYSQAKQRKLYNKAAVLLLV
jgi:hypothetical protein